MSTPIYDLTEWAPAQASPWVPHNVALRALEAACRAMVLDRDLSAPPGSCADGDTFLVAFSATGAWAGLDGKMAVAMGGNASNGWIALGMETPGQVLWVDDESVRIRWSGSAWVELLEAPQADQWKDPVRVATAGAGTLASDFEDGDTVDGVVLATGDRILIKDQAAPAENGIYVVAASGAPARAADADSDAELAGAAVFVSDGTAGALTQWRCTAELPLVLDTDPLSWVLTYAIPAGAVPQTREVTAGGALSGGGPLTGDLIISLDALSPDPAGVYANASIVVDEYGRVIEAEEGDPPTGIPEAPDDGEYYARRNEGWEPFTPGAAGPAETVTEAGAAADLDPGAAGKYQRWTYSAGAKTLTVRDEADVGLPADGEWHIRNAAANDLTLVEDTAVTIHPPSGGTLVVPVGGTVTLKRVAADEFDLLGQTVAAP